MKGYIEERAMEIARYIIDNNTTVRQAAKHFGISKSTVHTDVTKWNGLKVRLFGWLNRDNIREKRMIRIEYVAMTVKRSRIFSKDVVGMI